MRFYTPSECEEWLRSRQRQKPKDIADAHTLCLNYPSKLDCILEFADWIARSITYRRHALLWLTETDIWPGSENWHLYYRLRQTYFEHRLLHEAPGHLFLEHEVEDLTSFLQITMLNGWDGYLLTEADYVNAFFSHDGYVDFFAEIEGNLIDVLPAFQPLIHTHKKQ